MKRYSMISILLISLFLLLTGCGGKNSRSAETTDGQIRIYYRNADATSYLSEEYIPEASGDTAIREVYEVLAGGPFADGASAIPEGLELVRSAWQEHSLVLYLQGAYPAVGSSEEILCRFALVQTLIQLPDVEGVTILVNNQHLKDVKGREFGILTPDDFLNNVTTSDMGEESVLCKVYFADQAGVGLKACEVELKTNGTSPLEKQLVDQLISGPQQLGYFPVMPLGTKALSVSVHDRICYVNLNSSFLSNELTTPNRIRVYAIVNTLTELKEVDFVQLMVNGATDVIFEDGLSLTAPLESDSGLIG